MIALVRINHNNDRTVIRDVIRSSRAVYIGNGLRPHDLVLLWLVGHDEGVGDGRELLLVEARLGVTVGVGFGLGLGIGLTNGKNIPSHTHTRVSEAWKSHTNAINFNIRDTNNG